jgi:hypothetical protein
MAIDKDGPLSRLIEKALSAIDGLTPGEVSADGPTGSGKWLFTRGSAVLQFYSDRGVLAIAAG